MRETATDIEVQSYRIIARLIRDFLSRLSREMQYVIIRVVHATGDPSICGYISFSENFIEAGINALRERRPVVTDVKMVTAGISSRAQKAGANVYTVVDHAPHRYEKETPRLRGALRRLLETRPEIRDAVFVIGCSPLVLSELLDLEAQGYVDPQVVIACPPGFVNASEVKERLRGSGLPYFTVRGTRGGSTVAVSVFNSLVDILTERHKVIMRLVYEKI